MLHLQFGHSEINLSTLSNHSFWLLLGSNSWGPV